MKYRYLIAAFGLIMTGTALAASPVDFKLKLSNYYSSGGECYMKDMNTGKSGKPVSQGSANVEQFTYTYVPSSSCTTGWGTGTTEKVYIYCNNVNICGYEVATVYCTSGTSSEIRLISVTPAYTSKNSQRCSWTGSAYSSSNSSTAEFSVTVK